MGSQIICLPKSITNNFFYISAFSTRWQASRSFSYSHFQIPLSHFCSRNCVPLESGLFRSSLGDSVDLGQLGLWFPLVVIVHVCLLALPARVSAPWCSLLTSYGFHSRLLPKGQSQALQANHLSSHPRYNGWHVTYQKESTIMLFNIVYKFQFVKFKL